VEEVVAEAEATTKDQLVVFSINRSLRAVRRVGDLATRAKMMNDLEAHIQSVRRGIKRGEDYSFNARRIWEIGQRAQEYGA
jgi:hypothetical protein